MKKIKMLIVDDEELVINALIRLIDDLNLNLDIESTTRSELAIEWLNHQKYDILLTDQRMPLITGLELIERARKLQPQAYCLLMSGHTDFDMIVSAINDGQISGFIMKPWKGEEVQTMLEKTIQKKFELDSLMALRDLQLSSHQDWINAIEQIPTDSDGQVRKQIKALSTLIHAKDEELYEHSLRVSAYAMRIARVMGLTQDAITQLELAAMVHDLGKIAILDSIHYKTSSLNDGEYKEMKRHPQIGAEILRELEVDIQIIQIIEQHHERIDGQGYPKGLSGEKITLGAKILSVADAYDALTSDRIYRKGLSSYEALQILDSNINIIYEGSVVKALMQII